MRSSVLSILLIAGIGGTAFADVPIPPKPKPPVKVVEVIEVVAEPIGATKVAEKSLVLELSATGVTGGLLAITAVAWMQYNDYVARVATHEGNDQSHLPVARADFADMEKWERRTQVLAGATVISAGVTVFLWLRYRAKSSVTVQPKSDGGSVSYVRSF